jgi:hypothetical protein
MHLYIKVLFSRENLDFRPKSHDICRTFKLSLLAEKIWRKRKGNEQDGKSRLNIENEYVKLEIRL